MSTINFTVKITSSAPTLAKLKQLADKGNGLDTTALMRAWTDIYRSAMRRRFVQQSKGGGEWPDLKYMRLRTYLKVREQTRRLLNSEFKKKKPSDDLPLAKAVQATMERKHRPFRFKDPDLKK